jgi:hypothetical protein
VVWIHDNNSSIIGIGAPTQPTSENTNGDTECESEADHGGNEDKAEIVKLQVENSPAGWSGSTPDKYNLRSGRTAPFYFQFGIHFFFAASDNDGRSNYFHQRRRINVTASAKTFVSCHFFYRLLAAAKLAILLLFLSRVGRPTAGQRDPHRLGVFGSGNSGVDSLSQAIHLLHVRELFNALYSRLFGNTSR